MQEMYSCLGRERGQEPGDYCPAAHGQCSPERLRHEALDDGRFWIKEAKLQHIVLAALLFLRFTDLEEALVEQRKVCLQAPHAVGEAELLADDRWFVSGICAVTTNKDMFRGDAFWNLQVGFG